MKATTFSVFVTFILYKSIYLYNTKDDLINYKYQNTLHPYFQNCSYTFTLQMSVNTDLVKTLSKHHFNTEWKITKNESHHSMIDGLYMNTAVLHAAIQRNSHTHFIFTHVQWWNTQLLYTGIADKILCITDYEYKV